MAQQQGQETNNIGFQRIELLKEETLGVGSYGSVCKAKCDNLVCAAKIIHLTLVPPNAQQQIAQHRMHRLPIARFEKECDFLRDIRHPNIIQFIGTYQDPETGLPVLLMELMDESLTHFLETSNEPIPYHIQVGISHNINTALTFLHSNGIIHRDLSSNNILLIGKGVKAKLTDFGMAKLIDGSISNTVCPGTDAYMPPEATDTHAVFTEKGDIFSLGVNIIQILTKRFPKPGARHVTVPINDPRFPSGIIRVCVQEIERRSNHITEIDPTHPLLEIALDCLKDQEFQRPSADEIHQRLTAIKASPEYSESKTTQTREQGVISELRQQIQEQQTTLAQRDSQLADLRQELESKQQEYDEQNRHFTQVIAERQQETQELREQLATKDHIIETKDQNQRDHEEMITQFQRRIEELENTYMYRIQPLAQLSNVRERVIGDTIRLKWTEEYKAPCVMSRTTDAVAIDQVAYFRPYGSREIHTFYSRIGTWYPLPDCPIDDTTLAIVDGSLTAIGGKDSNQLLSLIDKGMEQTWTKVFPPMPTRRSWVIAVSTGKHLIVAGGVGGEKQELTKVEVLNTDSQQWSTAADLPQPLFAASAAVCGDQIYINKSKSVYTCTLSALLQSCDANNSSSRSLLYKFFKSSQQSSVWSNIPELQVEHSTLVSIENRLLAIGGRDSDCNPTTDIRMYNPDTNIWLTISHLSVPRWLCFAVAIQNEKIVIVGGFTSNSGHTASDITECCLLENML